jgi:AAA15 family ATPase/GTPase
MIVSFSVSNFRSFLSEETFSLVASNRISGTHNGHLVDIPDSEHKALRIGVIYGANGAGKSNLFKALRYMRSVVLGGKEKRVGTGRDAFRLSAESSQPSNFDLQFIVKDELYRFGFKADDDRITEEWLAVTRGAREETLYERITTTEGKVTVDVAGLTGADERLRALATVGGPQNQSFLATVHVTLDSAAYGDQLGAVINWFENSLKLIAPNASFGQLGPYLAENLDCKEFAGDFLRSVSTGVDHLEVTKREITEDHLRRLLPEDVAPRILKEVSDDNEPTVIRLPEGDNVLIERSDGNHFYLVTIQSGHQDNSGAKVSFELKDESDGTKRLLNLMPALYGLHNSDDVYFIDEIDRSLHPNLVWEFVSFFLKSCGNCKAQMILTTHESSLLDLDLLRRDEIWFAEKDQNQATRLYALTDFNVRKDLEIRKHYLNGRFGAVPFLGDLDRLLAEKKHPA